MIGRWVLCYERNVRCAWLKKHDPQHSGSTSLEKLALALVTSSDASPGPTMEQGKCTVLFLSLAVILDVVGLLLFLIGIFAPLSFWDFFVLSGPLLIFLSLVLWIFWYMGNLTVSEEELNLPKHDILWPKLAAGPNLDEALGNRSATTGGRATDTASEIYHPAIITKWRMCDDSHSRKVQEHFWLISLTWG